MEKDRAVERDVGALNHDGFVLVSLVLGGESRADRGKPTAQAAVRADRLARSVRCLSETDVNLALGSETSSRHEALYADVACCVEQSKTARDLAVCGIALVGPRVFETRRWIRTARDAPAGRRPGHM